ncbi:MAG: flagellar biosynthetic protein FliR [Oligoflexales bacterium]|nr:flagellar biosynthetic protein FliR [Oligoflexales bacterium]
MSFTLDLKTLAHLSLIFIRISCILTMLPLFGEDTTPLRVRLFFSLAILFALYPTVPLSFSENNGTLHFGRIFFSEIIIGLGFGFMSKLLLEALSMSSQLVGHQMGFATVNAIFSSDDPQVSSFMLLNKTVILIIFLTLNFHHVFIQAIHQSFSVVPIGSAHLSQEFLLFLLKNLRHIFLVSLQFSAPILISVLFATSVLGLLAKVFPQINIFSLSFPINFFVGLIVYVGSLRFFPSWIARFYSDHLNLIFETARSLVIYGS